MKTTDIRLSQIKIVPTAIQPSSFRTRKDWRRYQVLLKRIAADYDRRITASLIGTAPPPTSYPPKPTTRNPWLMNTDIC